jgi:hypothetical protein
MFHNFLKKDIKFAFLKKKSLKKISLRNNINRAKTIKIKNKREKNNYNSAENNRRKNLFILIKRKTKDISERKKEFRHIYILLDKLSFWIIRNKMA